MSETNPYGFTRTHNESGRRGIRCDACGWESTDQGAGRGIDGPVMRSHAAACPVEPRQYHIPAVCFR